MSKAPEPGICERLTRSHGTGDLHLEAAALIKELVEALTKARPFVIGCSEFMPDADVAAALTTINAALSRAGVTR